MLKYPDSEFHSQLLQPWSGPTSYSKKEVKEATRMKAGTKTKANWPQEHSSNIALAKSQSSKSKITTKTGEKKRACKSTSTEFYICLLKKEKKKKPETISVFAFHLLNRLCMTQVKKNQNIYQYKYTVCNCSIKSKWINTFISNATLPPIIK